MKSPRCCGEIRFSKGRMKSAFADEIIKTESEFDSVFMIIMFRK